MKLYTCTIFQHHKTNDTPHTSRVVSNNIKLMSMLVDVAKKLYLNEASCTLNPVQV